MNLAKSLLALAFAGLFFGSCKQADNAPQTANVAASTKTAAVKPETASFTIDGMTCAIGCAKTIQDNLSAMDGVQKAAVDFDKKTATVEYDATRQTPETLVKTVEAAGNGKTYKVSNLKTSEPMLAPDGKDKNSTGGKTGAPGKKDCCAGKHCEKV